MDIPGWVRPAAAVWGAIGAVMLMMGSAPKFAAKMPKDSAQSGATLLVLGALIFWGAGRLDSARDAPPAASMPADEAQFVAFLESARTNYAAAPNDLVRAKLRGERAQTLCDTAPRAAPRDWVGVASQIDGIEDGRGILTVQISPHVTMGTLHNRMSDEMNYAQTGERTLVPAGSDVAKAMAAMRIGQTVRFSAQFQRDGKKCLSELSLTGEGGISEPEFAVRFTAIAPAQ